MCTGKSKKVILICDRFNIVLVRPQKEENIFIINKRIVTRLTNAATKNVIRSYGLCFTLFTGYTFKEANIGQTRGKNTLAIPHSYQLTITEDFNNFSWYKRNLDH